MNAAVPSGLARFIKGVRVIGDGARGPDVYARLPDGELELLVRFGTGATTATLVGPRTRPLIKPAAGSASTLLIRFHAGGGYPFFGRPIDELTGTVVALSDLWRGDRWSRLATARGAAAIAGTAMSCLADVLGSPDLFEPASAASVRRAVRAVRSAATLPRPGALARDLGVTDRHLRRGFAQIVGLSPKQFLRIVRFRRALAWAGTATDPDWASIAHRAGYFDQPHMIADFRALAGATPGALLATRRSTSVGGRLGDDASHDVTPGDRSTPREPPYGHHRPPRSTSVSS